MAPTNNDGLERRGSQALVDAPKASPVDGLIHSAKDLVAQLTKAQQHFNVIAPVISTSKLADDFAASVSVVGIDLADNGGDVYSDHLMKGKVALTKLSLMRICAALGISWLGTTRLDNGRERFYWNVQVEGEYVAADGTKQRLVASKEIDFRDGSSQIAGKSAAEISRMRQHGQQLGETKAQLRAVRTLGIKPSYERQELARPFLIARISYVPDMSNPEVARWVTAARLGVAGLLYGAPAQSAQLTEGDGPLPAELGGPSAPAPKQVGAGTSANAAPAASTPPSGPRELDDDEAEEDTRPRYRVERALTQNAAGDFEIVLANGMSVLTADGAVAKAAARAKRTERAVMFVATQGRIDEIQVLDEPAPPAANAGGGDDGGQDDGLRTVAKVESFSGTNKTTKKPWTKYTIVLTTGESFTTFSESFAKAAEEARAAGWKVRVAGETNEKYPDQQDLTSFEAIDPRQGSLLSGQSEKY